MTDEALKRSLVKSHTRLYETLARPVLSYGSEVRTLRVGLGGLGVTCSPRDPRFAGSNPTQVDCLFQDVKILSTSPPGGTLSWGSESEISGSLKDLILKK